MKSAHMKGVLRDGVLLLKQNTALMSARERDSLPSQREE